MAETCGVVYVATGDQYIEESIKSIHSLKKNNSIDTTLYTDNRNFAERTDSKGLIDSIEPIDDCQGHYGDSIISPNMVQYDKTLFLDTDVYVCDDISEVFSLLDRFEIAAAHNPGSRTSRDTQGNEARNVPEAFPLYNTGVLALRKQHSVNKFLNSWRSKYNQLVKGSESKLNQPSFREALYESDLRIATLPSEYNCRIRYRGAVGFLISDVKIIHGRHPGKMTALEKELNSHIGMRVFTSKRFPIQVINRSPSTLFYIPSLVTELYSNERHYYSFTGRFVRSVNERGIIQTIQKVLKDLKS